jgi:hypothetical protein
LTFRSVRSLQRTARHGNGLSGFKRLEPPAPTEGASFTPLTRPKPEIASLSTDASNTPPSHQGLAIRAASRSASRLAAKKKAGGTRAPDRCLGGGAERIPLARSILSGGPPPGGRRSRGEAEPAPVGHRGCRPPTVPAEKTGVKKDNEIEENQGHTGGESRPPVLFLESAALDLCPDGHGCLPKILALPS